jgi:hypothetical protein
VEQSVGCVKSASGLSTRNQEQIAFGFEDHIFQPK